MDLVVLLVVLHQLSIPDKRELNLLIGVIYNLLRLRHRLLSLLNQLLLEQLLIQEVLGQRVLVYTLNDQGLAIILLVLLLGVLETTANFLLVL